MTRRFRPTDAFVDESIRGQRYLMARVLVQAHDMPAMRSDVGALAGTRTSRVHFNAELDSQRQVLLETFATFSIESFVVICRRRHGVTEFEARTRCLAHIVGALQLRSVDRLVNESRASCSSTGGGATSRCSGSPTVWRGPWAPGLAGQIYSAGGSARSSRSEKRRTRLPNQRVGNRVHFPQRWP